MADDRRAPRRDVVNAVGEAPATSTGHRPIASIVAIANARATMSGMRMAMIGSLANALDVASSAIAGDRPSRTSPPP